MINELKDRISKIRSGEVPNGYVKDKLGIVPKEWEEIKFSTLIDDYSEYTDDLSQFPLYSLTIEDGITAKTERYERSHLVKKSEAYKIIKSNDFAYNPMNARFGAIARNKEPFSVVVSGYYDIFSVKNKCDIEFMDSFLVSDAMIKYYNKVSTGSLAEKQRVHFSQFIDFRFKMPSLDERKKIAEILSTQDKVIALIQKQIEELKKLKKAYLQKMFPQKGSLFPEIRFKGFTDAWEQRKLGTIIKENLKPVSKPEGEYIRLGIRSHAKGTFHEVVPAGGGLNVDTMYAVEANNLIVNITFAWEEAWAITTDEDAEKLVSHRFPQYKFNSDQYPTFYKYRFNNARMKYDLELASPGGAGRNRVLNKSAFLKIPICIPMSYEEQQQIGTYFRNLDTLITLHQRKLEQEQQKKKALMQLLLTGIVRVKV